MRKKTGNIPPLADIVTLDFGGGHTLRIDTTTEAGRKKLARIFHVFAMGNCPLPAPGNLDSDNPRASEDFLKALPMIALRLSMAKMDFENSDYPVPKGHEIYEAGIFEVAGIRPKHMVELARVLQLIGQGVDARKLFRQDGRSKPKNRDHFGRALAYWTMRASDPTANDAEAVVAAQLEGYGKAPSPASIRKIAQKYRDRCLHTLEDPKWLGGHADDLAHQLGFSKDVYKPVDVGPLREHLRKKSRHMRDDMDEFLGGKHPRVRRRA